jgi:hypothetical protein
VLKTVCVSLEADPDRKWGNLTESLNWAMAKLDKIEQGTVRLELAGVEPKAAVPSASAMNTATSCCA